MRYDNLILKLFLKDNWHFRRSIYNKFCAYKERRYPNIYNYLIHERFSDTESIKESIYRMNFKIEKRPMCKACGNPVVFIGKNGVLFRDFCTVKCAQGNKEVQQKKAETDKSHHDGKRGWNCYDYNDKERINKWRNGVLKKWGDFKKAANIEKRLNTLHEKYGEHINSVMHLDWVKAKRNKSLTKDNAKSNSSKPEKKAFSLLQEIYPDIIFHYTSKDYPWNCDFYVPSKNLYIEYHGFYYHNGKPFEGTEDDMNKVKELQEKSKRLHKEWNVPLKNKIYPDMILYVWTDLDVRKRNHCKEHNINYLELYNLDEVKEYIRKKKENL